MSWSNNAIAPDREDIFRKKTLRTIGASIAIAVFLPLAVMIPTFLRAIKTGLPLALPAALMLLIFATYTMCFALFAERSLAPNDKRVKEAAGRVFLASMVPTVSAGLLWGACLLFNEHSRVAALDLASFALIVISILILRATLKPLNSRVLEANGVALSGGGKAQSGATEG